MTARCLMREFGTERKAGWWVLAADDAGPTEKLGTGGDERRVRGVVPNRRRRPADPHDPARPTNGCRCRTRLRRRHPASGQVVAVRRTEEADARRARAHARRVAGGVGRGTRARTSPHRGSFREQARRAFHCARQGRIAMPGVRERLEACLVRVARGRLLPDVSDRRQSAGRPSVVAA